MALKAAPDEKYTIRRKLFRIFGAGFTIFDAEGKTVGYCHQKAFRIREDIRVYTDESMSKELLRISTKSIWDISGTYVMTDGDGHILGAMARDGLKSMFFRDSWRILSKEGKQLGTLREDSGMLGVLRRYVDWVSLLSPEKFVVARDDGTELARFRQHFNWFVYRLGVAISPAIDAPGTEHDVDELFLIGAACLVAAIEGRQSSYG